MPFNLPIQTYIVCLRAKNLTTHKTRLRHSFYLRDRHIGFKEKKQPASKIKPVFTINYIYKINTDRNDKKVYSWNKSHSLWWLCAKQTNKNFLKVILFFIKITSQNFLRRKDDLLLSPWAWVKTNRLTQISCHNQMYLKWNNHCKAFAQ